MKKILALIFARLLLTACAQGQSQTSEVPPTEPAAVQDTAYWAEQIHCRS